MFEHLDKTFIVAEAGINHNGDLGAAFRMVDAAKAAGASAVKFQTYVTEKRVPKDSPIYGVLKKCELSRNDQKKIKAHADRLGIVFFSTPFDDESVKFLAELSVPFMKIASFDIVNKKLLEAAAATKIPAIISRGMADTAEIDAALAIFKKHGTEVVLLHCVSAYPAPKEAVNLAAIRTLAARYACPVGYSDHTLDLDAAVYAVILGAKIIEKHFTLEREQEGPDHKMSADPGLLEELCRRIREAEAMLGSGEIKSLPAEEGTRQYRRLS